MFDFCRRPGSPPSCVASYLHLGLNPGPNDVRLGSKLASQPLVGLLSRHLLLKHLVSEWNKVLHLRANNIRQVKSMESNFSSFVVSLRSTLSLHFLTNTFLTLS